VKLWLGLLAGVMVLVGCGSSAPQAPEHVDPQHGVEVLDRIPAKTGNWQALLERQREAERRRLAALKAARRSPTVEASLRVAQLSGRISANVEGRMLRNWRSANQTLGKLSGVRRNELGSVVGTIRALAAAHQLTVDRLDPLWLLLNTNARFWASAPVPAAGWRTTFGRDPVIFQYYPGRGLQVQPLASWGRANAIAGACLAALRSRSSRDSCRPAILTRSLDRLSSLGARRNGYLAWEYYFSFGSGSPPWVSGMAQATAIQALSRGYRALGMTRWKRSAERALGAFEQPAPRGVAVRVPGGTHYALYSFAPSHVVFNGGLQAVIGLRDAGALLHSQRAKRLFRAGDWAARREISAFDTGAWSLYSAGGSESNLNYHELIASFLGGLCNRVKAKVYCRANARFERYEREPPRIAVSSLRGLKAKRTTTVRFRLSKVSSVKVRVWGARGLSVSRDFAQLPRGTHAFAFQPPGRGRYHVRVEARGPSGPLGVYQRSVKVKLPKPAKKKKKPATPRKPSKGTRKGDAAAAASRRQSR
jgi:hypothetical protein